MQVIYVDDEIPALNRFESMAKSIDEIKSLKLFSDGNAAIDYVKNNAVDIAFLDMELSMTHGIQLAKEIKRINENIHIVFVTAYTKYAYEAFGVDAVDYILKPYSMVELIQVLAKTKRIKPISTKRVKICTMPDFSVWVDGNLIHLGRTKAEELFALLVDKYETGITSSEAIAYLWPERANDDKTQSLFRMTFKRLMDLLENHGVEYIIISKGKYKSIDIEKVDCDLYNLLMNGTKDSDKYTGLYMQKYSWAEERNGQLYSMFHL